MIRNLDFLAATFTFKASNKVLETMSCAGQFSENCHVLHRYWRKTTIVKKQKIYEHQLLVLASEVLLDQQVEGQ